MSKKRWRQVASVSVDSGTVWLGDPCYVLGADAEHGVVDWAAFCDLIAQTDHDAKNYSEPLLPNIGVAIHSGYGDGVYPVYIYERDGRVAGVMIDFMGIYPEIDPMPEMRKNTHPETERWESND